MELRVYVWVPEISEDWRARFRLLENIKDCFDREGIETPFPYLKLVHKKDLPPLRKKVLTGAESI